VHKTVVINIVGLTPRMVGDHTPNILSFARQGRQLPIRTILPAVTCSVQSTYLTGTYPSEHGIVGNGWYFRDECEVRFWRQSNHLVQQPKVWDTARTLHPSCTVANLFWWYNMYSTATIAVTPRPVYPADGRKLPDIYTIPSTLRSQLQTALGTFPLFQFWGPNTSIVSSRWIAEASMQTDALHNPTLTLIYIPHLDYGLQRAGPNDISITEDLQKTDEIVGDLISYYQACDARVLLLSEYGIVPVHTPVHLNRHFREQRWLAIREEEGREKLDAGECAAFAVADHQIAHVYVKHAYLLPAVKNLLKTIPGVAQVLDEEGKRAHHLHHERSGDLVVLANPQAWFTYYYWLDDARAPDFARTVDIHRKPGYDPVELFLNPADPLIKPKMALSLLKKKLGFRYLIQAIPLDATLVKGSHGLLTAPDDGPLLITAHPELLPEKPINATDIHAVILSSLMQ